ncbi:MAG: NAD-dependent epimerase/dehydratase family protein [Candidatus Marinimicrobia bacterium]|nr:NAD-dependent epimerase/dehydratase family protein [Candidatus Neomarinimicrobiota bacterium]
MSRILMTGGNGFIGSHIVELFLKEGHEVVCLVRQSGNLENLKGMKVRLVYGDIAHKETLSSSFKGIDFVIHNASHVRDWGKWSLFFDANVKGTLNVLEQCVENRIDHIIMTGTISSYGEEHSNTIKNETFPYNSHYKYFMDRIFPCKMNYYRDSKRMATRLASEFAETNGLNLTILEPVWVFGEREFSSGFYEYLQSVATGMAFMPGSRKNKFHVIYVKDLARAYRLAFEKKIRGVERFIIGNESSDNMYGLYSKFCEQAGLKMPRIIPKYLVYPPAFLMEWVATVLGFKKPPLLTRGRINMFYDNIEYSTQKAEKILGFYSEYTLDDAIARTVKWYQEKGYL